MPFLFPYFFLLPLLPPGNLVITRRITHFLDFFNKKFIDSTESLCKIIIYLLPQHYYKDWMIRNERKIYAFYVWSLWGRFFWKIYDVDRNYHVSSFRLFSMELFVLSGVGNTYLYLFQNVLQKHLQEILRESIFSESDRRHSELLVEPKKTFQAA